MKKRVPLSHRVHYAGRFGALYFITICCAVRRSNQLCHSEVAQIIFETARIYHAAEKWHLRLMVLMPDHLHALISIDGDGSLGTLIGSFKRITSKMTGLQWQRNFFDHRIRPSEGFEKKALYIRNNPVRAGLIASASNWPYQLATPTVCDQGKAVR
jgi:REP-associated tyrosine transposase